MLEKTEVIDLIELVENGCVQVRVKTGTMEDGSNSFHRYVVAPGDDYSKQDARVKNVCAEFHTPAVVAKYKAVQPAK